MKRKVVVRRKATVRAAKPVVLRARSWTAQQELYLKESYATTPMPTLAKVLGKKPGAIYVMASSLHLKKNKPSQRPAKVEQESSRAKHKAIPVPHVPGAVRATPAWSPEDDQYLREHYGKDSPVTVADALGRSVGTVYVRAHKLSLKAAPRPKKLSPERQARVHYEETKAPPVPVTSGVEFDSLPLSEKRKRIRDKYARASMVAKETDNEYMMRMRRQLGGEKKRVFND